MVFQLAIEDNARRFHVEECGVEIGYRRPQTASSLPLVGLGGIALLILAIGIGIYRRF